MGPSDNDLQLYLHIQLSSDLPWNPCAIELSNITPIQQEALKSRSLMPVRIDGAHDILYDISNVRQRFMSCATHTESSVLSNRDSSRIESTEQKPTTILTLPEPGPLSEYEIRPLHTFLLTDRHSTTSTEVLSGCRRCHCW